MRDEKSPDFQQAMLKLAQELGYGTSGWTPAQQRVLKMKVRTLRQLAQGALEAAESVVMTTTKLRVVPLPIADANLEQCRKNECGKYRDLRGRKKLIPSCDSCTCSGALLISKTRDAIQFCPEENPNTGLPYWDNRNVDPTLIAEVDSDA